MRRFIWMAAATLAVSCGTAPTNTPDSGQVPDSGSPPDSGTPPDAGTQPDSGTPPDAGNPDSGNPSDAGSTQTLTVKNYLKWCSVSIDGGTYNAANAVLTYPVDTGGTVQLKGKAKNATFLVGLWHHTDGDTTDAGETGTLSGTGVNTVSTTTATVGTSAKCVWICCPFAADGGGCPSADQCP